MSVSASNRVWKHSKHEDSMLVLMLALADRADDDGICWPGVDTLKVKIRKSERQTRRLISLAEQSGELYIKRGVGKGITSTYFITIGLECAEIQEILTRRFEIPDLLALQQSTVILDRLKGVICDTKRKRQKVTSNDTISENAKGDIQGTQKVTSRVSKGDMRDSSQTALVIDAHDIEGESSDPTYVLDTSVNTSISVVSNETTVPPSISVPEKPIEQPKPESESPEPKPEPLGNPNELPPTVPVSPPTAEPPKADAPPVHIAIIDAYWAGIPDDLRPIGKPPYSRHFRVAAELRDAGMTPERVSKFMAAKYPGYRDWCVGHHMPPVMPLEFVKKYIRAWITEDEKKPVAAQVEEFMDNWCDGCQRIKSYCVCGKEKPKPVESVVVTCWEHARGILTVILPKANRKLLGQIKPIEKRGDALVLEVSNPVFRDQLEMTLASKQFTDPIRLLSGGELTNFRVVVA